MQNKSKTYILLIGVLIIWGVLGFKIVSAVNPNVPVPESHNMSMAFNPKMVKELDTFSIKGVHRDPFLGTLEKKRVAKTNVKVSIKKELLWKPIQYHGTIAKKDSKTNLFIVTIDGSQYLMKIRQTIDEVKLIKGNDENIVLNYKGQNKAFQKA